MSSGLQVLSSSVSSYLDTTRTNKSTNLLAGEDPRGVGSLSQNNVRVNLVGNS